MASDKNDQLENFLDENPEFKGKFLGYQHSKRKEHQWFSRINDGWFECEEYFIEVSDLIEVLEMLKKDRN